MPSRRTMALAAVLLLAVPALGTAAPVILSTHVDERLVEGHTVFTVMEVRATTEQAGATRFAAAVAVLVREYSASSTQVRFPGVLWFNDQYLVNPHDQRDRAESWRHPCGGAVMAVNQGDPDPRLALASVHARTPAVDVGSPSERSLANASADARPEPSADPGTPPSTSGGSDPSVTPGQPPGADPGTPPSADADAAADPGAPPSGSGGSPPSASGGSPPSVDTGGPSADPGTPPDVDEGSPPDVDEGTPPSAQPENVEADPGAPPSADPGTPPTADPGAPPTADPGAPPSASPGGNVSAGASSDTGTTAAHPVEGTPGHSQPSRNVPPAGPFPGASVPGFTVPPNSFGMSYKETYQITDPNDHVWTIDRYDAYHRSGFSTAAGAYTGAVSYRFPVWVVNLLGAPTFLPDDGVSNCHPYLDGVFQPVFDAVPNTDLPEQPSRPIPYPTPPPTGAPQSVPGTQDSTQPEATKINDGKCDGNDYPPVDPPYSRTDDPCAGHRGVSRNGYCYGGQPSTGGCANKPLRTYNALLYFKLQDLTVSGAPRSHDAGSTDTNGCQTGTEWECPDDEDDKEGNSHPFHPVSHATHRDEGPCRPAAAGPQGAPTNHGGSVGATPANHKGDGWYEGLPCELAHATRDVDVYYSPHARPVRPATSHVTHDVSDTQGSDAPFHDDATAYP